MSTPPNGNHREVAGLRVDDINKVLLAQAIRDGREDLAAVADLLVERWAEVGIRATPGALYRNTDGRLVLHGWTWEAIPSLPPLRLVPSADE